MKIGVLGTGQVGATLANKLIGLGHEVKMGSRTADNEKAAAWSAQAGPGASHGTFADAAAFAVLLFNCTHGTRSLNALQAAGEHNLADKILVDVSNPLEMVPGKGPRLSFGNDDSLGERLQSAFPKLKVVKTLNTVNCAVMVDPARVAGEHTMFLCGNDASAKLFVRELLSDWFGWQDIIDLGDISSARATEALMPIWLKLWGTLKTPDFNMRVVRSP